MYVESSLHIENQEIRGGTKSRTSGSYGSELG